MKTLTALFSASLIALTTSLAASLAHARDLGPDEALRLRDAGTIVSFEKLNATALSRQRHGHRTERHSTAQHSTRLPDHGPTFAPSAATNQGVVT